MPDLSLSPLFCHLHCFTFPFILPFLCVLCSLATYTGTAAHLNAAEE